MKYEYDKEADGLYIWFVKNIEEERANYEKEIWPTELSGEIGIIFSNDNKIMGIEVLPASKYFDSKQLKQLDEE